MQYVYRSEQVSNPSKACEEHRQKSFLFYVNNKGPYFVGQPLASDPPETVMRHVIIAVLEESLSDFLPAKLAMTCSEVLWDTRNKSFDKSSFRRPSAKFY
jgi:hypothetical protein